MFSYRITKYNPVFRDVSGAYLKNDWTSFFDIGRTFDAIPLNLAMYQVVEDAYVKAVLLFMRCLNISTLQISNLRKHDLLKNNHYPESLVCTYNAIYNGQQVHYEQVADIRRYWLSVTVQ